MVSRCDNRITIYIIIIIIIIMIIVRTYMIIISGRREYKCNDNI